MTLNERAETRRETFYRLTNSAEAPDVPSGNRNLLLYSADPSKAPSGYYGFAGTQKTSETYDGSVVYRVRSIWNSLRVNLGNLADRGLLKVGDVLTYSVAMRAEQETAIQARLFVRYTNESDAGSPTGQVEIVNLTTDWQKVNVTFTVTAKMLAENTKVTYLGWEPTSNAESDKYVYYACNKIERGNIATDWSPASEDLGWSPATLVPTQQQRYLWKFEYVYYSDGSVEVTQPVNLSIAGADADTTGITDAINQTNQTVAGLQSSVSQAQSDLATVSSNLTQARQNLESSIASVNTKTQAVETTLAQVQSTANANNQKTATLENDLDGLSARFSSLKIGTVNLFKGSRDFSGSDWVSGAGVYAEDYQDVKIFKKQSMWGGRSQYFEVKAGEEYVFSAYVKSSAETDRVTFYLTHNSKEPQAQGWVGLETADSWGAVSFDFTDEYQRIAIKIKITSSGWIMPRIERFNNEAYLFFGGYKLERGNVATDYSPNEADIEQTVAEYKQTADQNYASLQSTVQALDGTVTTNKATADQTAAGFKTRIESLETYQSGESTRANQYFESAKTETARQLTAERTAIANDYVAKSTYTSDVTGLRNDLTATTTTANTTKTSLASYQASNDQAVASLQSSLQTTDGNVSSLQTQINAVPGQITSAVSAVEGKIPTSIGGTNLLLYSADPWKAPNDYYQFNAVTKTDETLNGSIVYKTHTAWASLRSNWGKQLIDRKSVKIGDEFTYSIYAKTDQSSMKVRLFDRFSGQSGADALTGEIALTNEWQKLSVTFKVTQKMVASQSKLSWVGFEQVTNSESGKYVYYACNKLERGNIATDYSPNPEDYDVAITQAKSEIKQTTDAITASVSSVETKADNAQTAVNTLDSEVVKSASLNLDNNGFVTKVGKTIDGNKFATMIAQNANNVKIIADEMQVTADMIVDGAVTANKLNVNNLSAVNSDLGAIKGGSLLLQENKTAGSATDSWGTYNRPAYKQGLFLDNHALASSGAIQRKNGNETTPTDMPLAVLQAGELRFLVVDYNDNLENVVHYGLSDPDFGAIRFEIDSELKRRLTMTSSGYLNFQATNYTNWQSTGVSGCEYMIQGRLVLVNYDVTFNSAGTHTIGSVPQEFVRKSLMLTAKGWSVIPRDKNAQLNPDGSLHILDAEANVNYRGTLVFSY